MIITSKQLKEKIVVGGDDLNNSDNGYVSFTLGGMNFEYDENKNRKNIEKHGISFKSAARVFFDYDRIEYYDEENSVKDIISDKPIKINKQILDLNDPNVPEGLNKKDVFYNFPIFIRNDLSLSGKTIGNLSDGTKVYSLWMDKNDEIIIPTIVAINESADTVYYCYRKVKNKNTKDHVNIKDNTWEDKNGDNDNVWEDEITVEYTQSEHLRKQDDSLEDQSKYPLNTIRNRLYNKTLNFYVRWRVSENDNITYEIDGDVSQNTKNVASELSLTSVTREGENG